MYQFSYWLIEILARYKESSISSLKGIIQEIWRILEICQRWRHKKNTKTGLICLWPADFLQTIIVLESSSLNKIKLDNIRCCSWSAVPLSSRWSILFDKILLFDRPPPLVTAYKECAIVNRCQKLTCPAELRQFYFQIVDSFCCRYKLCNILSIDSKVDNFCM